MNAFRVIHLPTQDDATTVAFVERTCPACAGEGCDTCHGGGTVGSVEQVATRQVAPSPEADRARRDGTAFRRHRVDAGVSLGDLADALGPLPEGEAGELVRALRETARLAFALRDSGADIYRLRPAVRVVELLVTGAGDARR